MANSQTSDFLSRIDAELARRGAGGAPTTSDDFSARVQAELQNRGIDTGVAALPQQSVLGSLKDLGRSGVSGALGTLFMGGGDIQRGLAERGFAHQPGLEPEGAEHRAARISGSTLPILGSMGIAGIRHLGKAAADLGPIQRITQSVAARPGATLAAEVPAIAGATIGGEFGADVSPEFMDPEVGEVIGELVGGIGGAGIGAAAKYMPARQVYEKAKMTFLSFTKAGATPRAGRRLQTASEDAALAAARLEPGGADTMPGVPMSASRIAGDRRLLGIEKAVANDDPAFAAALREELEAGAETLQREAPGFITGTPKTKDERTIQILRKKRDYVLGLADVRVKKAAAEAEEAVRALHVDATPREISKAARGKIESALKDFKTTDTDMWRVIDKTPPATLDNAVATFGEHVKDAGRFGTPPPSWLAEALDTKGPLTVADVHSLRTRLGFEIASESTSQRPNRDHLRLYAKMYGALLDDMDSVPSQSEELKTAIAHTRKLHQTFHQGKVGELIGIASDTSLKVDPEDTLRVLMTGGRIGTQARQMLAAAPESGAELGEFLKVAFKEQVLGGRALRYSEASHRAFLKKHGEVLEVLPGLEREFDAVGDTAKALQEARGRVDLVDRLAHNAQKSRVALYLDASKGESWAAVLRSDKPEAAAASLLRKVSVDKDAVKGFQSGLVDELLRSAGKGGAGGITEEGTWLMSGRKLMRLVSENEGVMKAAGMDDGAIERMKIVARTASRLEMKPQEGMKVIEDTPAKLLNFLVGWWGARQGQRIAGGGMGASLKVASATSKAYTDLLQNMTVDKASGIIAAAVRDKELMRSLLVSTAAGPRAMAAAVRRVNAWLADPAAQAIGMGQTENQGEIR